MLQALMNVWWLFAGGFALGAIFVCFTMFGDAGYDARQDWTKNASNLFGAIIGYIIGWFLMVCCGVLLLVCFVGWLI